MKDTTPFIIIPCLVLVLFACVFSNLLGRTNGIEQMKEESVRAGVAEWVADASGKPKFKWKECK